jgi:hypothetical protein
MATELRAQKKMDITDTQRGRFSFPIDGSTYLDGLRRILVTESKIADNALLDALQDYINETFKSWFGKNIPDHPSYLKRLTNSLSASGSVPEANTLKVLEEIENWNQCRIDITPKKAAELLRSGTTYFRQARTFLFHQSKCVNGVIGSMDPSEEELGPTQVKKMRSLLNKELDSYSACIEWSSEVGELFLNLRAGGQNMKNVRMYIGLWEKFNILIAQNKGENELCYADYLSERVKEYLDPQGRSTFENFVAGQIEDLKLLRRPQRTVETTVSPDFVSKDGVSFEIKINEGVVTLIFVLEDISESKASNLVSELTYEFAMDSVFSKLEISIGMEFSAPPVMKVSLGNLGSPEQLNSVKQHVIKKLAK